MNQRSAALRLRAAPRGAAAFGVRVRHDGQIRAKLVFIAALCPAMVRPTTERVEIGRSPISRHCRPEREARSVGNP